MRAASLPLRCAAALAVTLFLLGGAVAVASPAAAAVPATVTDVSVAPYEAVNPLVPSASLPFLAATVSFDRTLPNVGETFEVVLPAGTRAVLTPAPSTALADGAALVTFALSDDGGTLIGTFTSDAADALRVTGEFSFFLEVVDSSVLSPAGGTYRPVFLADGVPFERSVSYGSSVDLSSHVGGHWTRGAAGATPARFVVQAKADGHADDIPHGGLWIGAGVDTLAAPFSNSAPDCAATQVRVFADDPGAMNYPIAGGSILRAGTDYSLNCEDVVDGRTLVGVIIPEPQDGAFYVLSSPRDVVGEQQFLTVDNPAVPEAGRQVALHMPAASTSDARRDPSNDMRTSTLMLYAGRSAGIGSAEAAAPALELDAISNPASGTDVRAGDRVTYTLSLRNSGNTTTPDAAITADLREVLRLAALSGTISASSGMARLDGTTLRWEGGLAPGESVEVTFAVAFRTAGELAEVTFVAESRGARGGPVAAEPVTITHDVLAAPAIELPGQLAQSGAESAGALVLGAGLVLSGALLLALRHGPAAVGVLVRRRR